MDTNKNREDFCPNCKEWHVMWWHEDFFFVCSSCFCESKIINPYDHAPKKGAERVMADINELHDKVFYAKNRIWTIYGTTHDGVFCYQGIKPHPNFRYDSRTMRKNTSYFKFEDIKDDFIEGEEIDWCMKKMVAADKKTLTKKHAIDFYVYLTGHTKSFVSKNIEEKFNGFSFVPGDVCYDLWKSDGALSLSHNIHGTTTIAHFDFLTFKTHNTLNEKSDDAYKEEIIENYKGGISE